MPPTCGILIWNCVGEQHKVIRKIVEQGGRGISLLAAIQMPGIVLDAGAVAQFLHHFQIKLRALLQALRLNQLVLGLEQAQPLPSSSRTSDMARSRLSLSDT